MGKGRCQVYGCKQPAKWVCVESKLRYCEEHKHPHKPGEDEPAHTHKRYKYIKPVDDIPEPVNEIRELWDGKTKL